MMYGARDHDLETGTYIKTHCLTFLFIPILALRSYRVADAESGGWYFIGREPVSGFAWGWNILFAASVVLGVGGAIVGVAIHEMDRHANGPDMVAQRELEEANALAEKQEWVPAAQKYAKLIRDRSPVKSEAQVRLEDLYAAAEENANAVDFAQLMDLGTELNDEQIFIKNLLKIGLRGVERFAESDPKQAYKILANVDRLLLDGMRVAPLDVKRLAKLRRKVLSRLVAADPGDMTIVGQYCELLEADGEFDTCRKLLERHAGALGTTEGARILGRIYSREGKSDKAHALLVPYCKQRLQVLHAAEKKYNAAYESFATRIIDEVNSHRGHDQFRAGLKGLDQAQKRAAQRKYIAERIKYDPAVNSARKDFQQAAGVVPVAMELGVLQLQRARRMSDPAERKRELKQAEETFLAIQSAAGNDDTYRLQLGQVYYWLGREAEGRKLFDELLAARKRAPVILLTVARELRRLGAESEARRLAEEAFNTSKRVPVKQAAAAIRSLLTDDLDEKIIWLKRARQDSDAIQAELNLTMGRVAVRDGRRTDAEGHFRKAITLYGKLPESATSLNNSALIWNELYEITRNESDFEEVTRRMKKAVSLSPTSPILMGNTGSFLIRGALQSLLNGNVDLKTLEMTASIGVIGYLYRNQQERDEWIAKIRKRAGIRDGMTFLNNAVTLSPKGTRHYTELLSLELFLHDVEALRELKRRIVAANVDTETQTKQMLDYLGGKDLKKRLTQYQKSIERQRASISRNENRQHMKIAGIQMDVTLADVASNVKTICERLRQTAAAGAKLAIFPECATTGYCFEDLDEARPYAESIPGPTTHAVAECCGELGVFAIFGMIETATYGGVFNALALVGPDGLIGAYRKVHLPFLGVDRFANYGDRPFAVHDAGNVRVGMNICYDSAFPEASRSLTLLGADLIALPTNWPPGAECVAENAINTRAMENAVYYAAVNRVGTERGFTFIGKSRICGPSGQTLVTGSDSEEEILYADIDPEIARNKRVVREPGRHAIDRLADRRPEMYADLVKPHTLPRPGREK
eukprot:g21902.t1